MPRRNRDCVFSTRDRELNALNEKLDDVLAKTRALSSFTERQHDKIRSDISSFERKLERSDANLAEVERRMNEGSELICGALVDMCTDVNSIIEEQSRLKEKDAQDTVPKENGSLGEAGFGNFPTANGEQGDSFSSSSIANNKDKNTEESNTQVTSGPSNHTSEVQRTTERRLQEPNGHVPVQPSNYTSNDYVPVQQDIQVSGNEADGTRSPPAFEGLPDLKLPSDGSGCYPLFPANELAQPATSHEDVLGVDNEMEELPPGIEEEHANLNLDVSAGNAEHNVDGLRSSNCFPEDHPNGGHAVPEHLRLDVGLEPVNLNSSLFSDTMSQDVPTHSFEKDSEADTVSTPDDIVEGEAEEIFLRASIPEKDDLPTGFAGPSTAPENAMEFRYAKYDAAELVGEANLLKKRFCSVSEPSIPSQVYQMYMDAVDRGNDINALLMLARLNLEGAETVHVSGKRLPVNMEKAKEFLEKLKEHSMKHEFKSELLILEGDILMKEGSVSREGKRNALALYKEAAQKGNPAALFKLGEWYFKSHSGKRYGKKMEYLDIAVTELSKAVEAGYGPAAELLGTLYQNEVNDRLWKGAIDKYEAELSNSEAGSSKVPRSRKSTRVRNLRKPARDKKAKSLYFAAADWGYPKGIARCGECYQAGFSDVPRNFEQAVEQYCTAFEAGYYEAAVKLGLLYDPDGDFSDKADQGKAVKWYERGAKCRCPNATWRLGQTYDDGKMVNRDAKRAIRYFEESIDLAMSSGKNELAHQVREDHQKILVTQALVEEDEAAQQFVQEDKNAKMLMKKVLNQTQWIVAGFLRPDEFTTHPSYRRSKKTFNVTLGDTNSRLVETYISSLCENITGNTPDKGESFRQLRLFVPDNNWRIELSLSESMA